MKPLTRMMVDLGHFQGIVYELGQGSVVRRHGDRHRILHGNDMNIVESLREKSKYIALFVCIAAFTVLWLIPIKYTIIRIASAISLIGAYVSTLAVCWRVMWLRAICIMIMMLCVVFLALPIGEVEGQISGESYSKELKKYENTSYVWGGENSLGIDCSGLIRKSLVDLTIKEAIMKLNPAMLRYGIRLWHNDASARHMAIGYDDRIVKVYANKTINDLDSRSVNIGDIAITGDGIHVLAYVGNDEWIQSDPMDMKVTINESKAKNPWFSKVVNIYRFKCIGEP